MMAMCSKKAYFKPSTKSTNVMFDDEEDVDPNVVQIKFDCLKENVVKIHQGDPVTCQKCESVLNKHSKINEKIEQEENQFQQQQLNKHLWICEFCNHQNFIQIEKEEIPQQEDVIYLIQSVQEIQKVNVDQSENSIIFCIDNSGSMCTSTEIKGKIKFRHGISQEEYEMLKQFIEPGDEQQIMPGKKKDVTFISRKQCVLAAIEQQIAELKKEHPKKLVGLVTFNNEVQIFGDGSQQPLTIAGDRLFKVDEIKQQVKAQAAKILSRPVKDSADLILERFDKLQEKGQTALGPALLASLEIAAQGKAGSMVIICTDGLANLGIGSFEGAEYQEFYDSLSLFASENGIVVSIVTIKGEGCKMEVLSSIVEKTNGTVTRVKPEDIQKDFANILKDELVGTKVELVIRLHRALKFRGEEDQTLTTTLKRMVGNATVATTVTFEYQVKAEQELKAEQIDISQIKQVPFQIKVYYTNLHGDKLMRVVTNMVETTEDLKEVEKEAKVEILHKRMAQKTAQLAKNKQFSKAQTYNDKWDNYVQSNEQMNSNETNKVQNISYQDKNLKLKKAVDKQDRRSQRVETEKKVGFLEKISSVFKGSQQQQQKPQQQQQQQQQQQLQKVEEKEQKIQVQKLERKESIQSESDEDQDMADLFGFEQAKM